MRVKKKGTPAWIDKLLSFRQEITEDEYRDAWKKLNKVRKDQEEWNRLGQQIIRDLEGEKAIFRSKDFRDSKLALQAAKVYQDDNGGRIVRRNAKGQFSKRGRTFQVIGAK